MLTLKTDPNWTEVQFKGWKNEAKNLEIRPTGYYSWRLWDGTLDEPVSEQLELDEAYEDARGLLMLRMNDCGLVRQNFPGNYIWGNERVCIERDDDTWTVGRRPTSDERQDGEVVQDVGIYPTLAEAYLAAEAYLIGLSVGMKI